MRKKICLGLAFFAFLSLPAILSAQTLPLDNDFLAYQNKIIDRLVDRGLLPLSFFGTRPYRVEELVAAIEAAYRIPESRLGKLDSLHLQQLSQTLRSYFGERDGIKAVVDLSSEGIKPQEGKSYTAETIRGSLVCSLSNRINIYGLFALDENLADDPLYDGKVWRSLAGQLERAYAEIEFKGIQAYFGREKSAWGPGRKGNLLLSTHSQAMDQIKLTATLGPIRFSSITAVLDDEENSLVLQDTALDWDINRYFSAHRLEIMPNERLSIGLSESVIYGGAGRGLEFYYTNPLTWYHGEQLNKAKDDNTFIGLDLTWYPRWGVRLYGELLIDDFQIEKRTAGDQEPSEVGYLAGANVSEPWHLRGIDIGFEYVRINNWTYNQAETYNRYIHNNRIIGHYLGPDRESYYLSLKKWFAGGAWLILSYEHQNAGEGNVFSDWTMPWIYQNPGRADFLSGIVERREIFGISLKIFKWKNLQIDFDNFLDLYTNQDHRAGVNKSLYRGRLQARYCFGLL